MYLGWSPQWINVHQKFCSRLQHQRNHVRQVSKSNFQGLRFYRGVEVSVFLLISEWALQQCSATAMPVIQLKLLPIQSQKVVAMATSLSCEVLAKSAICRPTTKTPSITNRLVAIVHTKPVIASSVAKLVAMATSLRPPPRWATPRPPEFAEICLARYRGNPVIVTDKVELH